MSALIADRDTRERPGVLCTYPVAAGSVIHAGGIVVLDGGYAKPAAIDTGLVVAGRAEQRVDNAAGDNGDAVVTVKSGIFHYANSAAGDQITRGEIGLPCWLVDDQTVAKTNGALTRSIAGKVVDVDDVGVWVQLTPLPSAAAINNLGDVADPAVARANIGTNKIHLPVEVASLIGSGVARVVAPTAGSITKIRSVTSAALATGDATLTAAINGGAVADGVITITQIGSAAGDVDSATPSAANAVVAGDVISITVGGTNSAAAAASLILEITY